MDGCVRTSDPDDTRLCELSALSQKGTGMKKVIVIYDDSLKPNKEIRSITGDKSYGDTIFKRVTLKNRMREEIEKNKNVVSMYSISDERENEKLKEELKKVEISDSFVPYIANVTADYVTKKEEVKPLLASQVSSSVRWQQTIERLLADGADEFVEIGPGRTLSGFVKKVNRDVKVSRIDKMEEFMKIIGSHVEAGAC